VLSIYNIGVNCRVTENAFNQLAVQLIDLSAYRPLSAFKTPEITDTFKHVASFAVRLFPVANCASFVHKKLGLRVMVSCCGGVHRPPFLTMSLMLCALNADSGRYADTQVH